MTWAQAPRTPSDLGGPSLHLGDHDPPPPATGRWTSCKNRNPVCSPPLTPPACLAPEARPCQWPAAPPVWTCKCQQAPGGSRCQAGVPGGGGGTAAATSWQQAGATGIKAAADTPPEPRGNQAEVSSGAGVAGPHVAHHDLGVLSSLGTRGGPGVCEGRNRRRRRGQPREPSLKAPAWLGLQEEVHEAGAGTGREWLGLGSEGKAESCSLTWGPPQC